MIEVDFGENVFEKLIAGRVPGKPLTATALLTALDMEGDEEAFAQTDFWSVPLDISDLPKAPGTGEAAVRLRREEQLAASGNLLKDLEETDPLRLYLEELAAIPACGEETLLAQELLEANQAGREAPELYQRLLNLSLSRVVEIAGEYTGYGVLLLDLIQEGGMGLWQYLPRFTGGDFAVFRDDCVRLVMKKALILQAHANGVGQKMRQAMEDYRAVDERLLGELGRNATLEEIATELHMSPEEAAVIGANLETARTVSRAKTPEPEADVDDDKAVEDTAYFQTRQRIEELLSGLEETDAKLLTLRFGLEGGLPVSPEDTGKRLGLTPEEVVAREAAALAKLRG